MSETNFKNLQKEVCAPELEPPPLKKFCAPCVPNQNYIEPDWEFVEIGEPYLNEKQCEYQATLTVNKFGDSFTAREFRDLQGRQEGFASRDLLLRSFIHPAIVLILEEYGKLVADQIICATFPGLEEIGTPQEIVSQFDSFEGAFIKLSEQQIDRNRVRCKDLPIATVTKTDPSEPFDFQQAIANNGSISQVQNPFALELYAQVNDFYIDPIENVLKVHIGIPAFIVDQVPTLPSKEELEEEAMTTQKSAALDVKSLFGQIKRLSVSLQTFGKYQSNFYQTQDGFLKFKENGKDYYATRMSSKVDQFYSDLKQLATKNDMNIRSNTPSLNKLNADNVRIDFKTGPNGNPYTIKAIYAWKEGCDEQKLRKGIKKFKKKYDKRPTLLNYIAKIGDIDMTLQARETLPWLDFLVKYTYPLITVDYGNLNMQSVGDSLGKCVEENVREFGGELRDYVLNEALSFMESLSFQYSSAASCEDLYSAENQPEKKEFEKVDYGYGEQRAAKKALKEQQDARPDDKQEIIDTIIVLDRRITLIRTQQENMQILIDETQEQLAILDNAALRAKIVEYDKALNTLRETELSTKLERARLNSKLRTLNKDDGEKLQRKKERTQRKNVGKKARRNAKSHPYTKKAHKIAREEMKKSDTLLSSLIDWEEYEKTGKPSFKKMEQKIGSLDDMKDLLARLSICNLNAITINAIRCLFSGVTKERAFDKMFRAAMQAMDLDVFGFFIGGLPPDKQAELRKKMEAEFGNIPLPWEDDYDSGAANQNAYKSYLSADATGAKDKSKEKNALRQQIRTLKGNIRDLEKSIGSEAVNAEEELKAVNLTIKEFEDFFALSNEQRLASDNDPTTSSSGQQQFDLYTAAKERKKYLTGLVDNPQSKLLAEFANKLETLESQAAAIQPVEIRQTGLGEEFDAMTDEEKSELLEEQKKAQGTFGKPLGNIQEAVVEAYMDYIFDVMNVDEIGDYLSQVPGGTLVFNTLDQIFKCSTQGQFNPPIKSFLSSLSLDVCGPTRHVGLAWPEKIKEIKEPLSFNRAFFLTKLRNAFITKVETVITKVITMLILKLFETLDNALCKSLNAISQAAIGTLTGGSSSGLDEAFADAFCADANADELKNVQRNAFGNALGEGAAPDSAYDCLFKAINGTMSKREIIDLLTNTPSNMDDQIASKFSLLVNSKCPELSDLLGDVEAVKDAFGSMGKYIPPDLKDFLKKQSEEDLDAPIYDAICLTQPELDLWNANRKNLYLDNGLDEATADDMINKANDRALDNLGSLADILQKGPDGLLGEALDAILKQADPACANDPSAIIMEDESLAKDKQDLLNGYFKRIESSFLQDLIGERRSLIGNILIDTRGNHLQQHNRQVKIGDRTFLYANYVDTEEQWDKRKDDAGFIKNKIMDKGDERGMLPETVGLQTMNQIRELPLDYKTNKHEPQLRMRFQDSENPNYESLLSYELSHDEKSTQRIRIKETNIVKLLGIKLSEDTETVLNTTKENHFNKKEIGLVNYEVAPNEIKLFSDLLKQKSGSSKPPITSKIIELFDRLNTKALRTIRNTIVETPNGNTPVGFNFGYDQQQAIGFEDMIYVDPTADPNDQSTWKYTHDEEDSVLGKSATENPRVYFLDPIVHGGRFKAPKIYIEPATYNGWLGTIKTFVPQLEACEDKDNGFLNMTEIAERAKQVESNLPLDERLSQPLECRLEVPYDRQVMPANHGLIEGIMISTIRTYATEFMVRTFPVFGSIRFSDLNVDSLITKSIADVMQREMSEAGYLSSISRLAYYLLFLEQAVQVVQRQIIDGLMEETEEIREASKVINKAQNNYERLKVSELLFGEIPSSIGTQLLNGSRILAYGNKWPSITTDYPLNFKTLNGYKINLARKVAVIYDTQDAAKVFLAALIEKETVILSKKLNLNLRPRPHVFDIKKFMLSTEGMLDQSAIKSGFTTVEQEVIEGGSKPDYGDILSCASEDLESPLGTITKTLEDIEKTGVMYLEKYIRVINKDATQQVMKVSEFQSMMSDRTIYDENSKLSDYFGNAFVILGDKLEGSIGVKFGVRLMMCLPETIGLEPDLDSNIERLPQSIISGEDTVALHHIPVSSYELDVMDVEIKELDLEDPNMGEDIKCYVDRLSEEDSFTTLFEKIFKIKSFTSLFGVYSYQNFIESIGKLEVEEDRQMFIENGWKKRIFNDTKRLLRKQFRSVYNSQDDTNDGRSSRNRQSNINFLKNLIPDLYLNISGVGFLQRLRIVDAKPFDEDGKPCVNEFQKLFEDD
jgi:hypothetical protein